MEITDLRIFLKIQVCLSVCLTFCENADAGDLGLMTLLHVCMSPIIQKGRILGYQSHVQVGRGSDQQGQNLTVACGH